MSEPIEKLDLSDVDVDATPDPFATYGITGLKRSSVDGYGTIDEEWHRELQGSSGAKMYREIADNNATVGAVLFTCDSFTRQLEFEVDAADDSPQAEEAKEFFETVLADLDQSFSNLIGEIVKGVIVYGWAAFEPIYKMRQGMKKDKRKSSNYDDNRIGVQSLAPRSQDSLYGWEFTEEGYVKGMYQLAGPTYEVKLIPVDKLFLFRSVGTMKDNPEGHSALRSCYTSYYMLKRLQIAESIGISRNLAGIPVMECPIQMLSDNATATQKSLVANFRDMVARIKADTYSGLVLPSSTNPDGTPSGFRLTLLNGNTGKTADTTPVIERLEGNIARSFLADWLFLGSGTTGSWALSSSKTNMFARGLGGYLSAIMAVFNEEIIPQIMRLNGLNDAALFPTLRHGDLEKADIAELAAPLVSLAQAGLLTPDDELEKHIRELSGLPQSEIGQGSARPHPLDADEGELTNEAQAEAEISTAPESDEVSEDNVDRGIETGDSSVSDVTMNGAQVASLLQIIEQVNAKTLPTPAAIQLIQTAFNMDAEIAAKLVSGEESL